MKKVIIFPAILMLAAICFIVLHSLRVFEAKPILEYFSLILILLGAVIQSYRNVNMLKKNQQLSEELARVNEKLEKTVEKRTEQLHEKNQKLAELEMNRTKLLAYIAHDLGSPILGIQTYLNLMKEGIIQTDDKEMLQQLYEKTEYMKRLVDDLFELSKLESKELSFEMGKIKFKDFITEAVKSFATDLRHESRILKFGRLDTAISGEEVFVNIDSYRILQVLQNFIDNAVKFHNGQNEEPIIINCFIDENQGDKKRGYNLWIEVVDQGEGISPKELPFVFQRFYKGKTGNKNGSGLGLSIAKEIIEQHGGKVGVTSKLDQGSTFYFILPCFLEAESLPDDS